MSTDQAEGDPGAEVVPAVSGEVVPANSAPAPGELARAVYADITRVPGERLPILPVSLRGRANFRASVALGWWQTWHRTRYHGLRSPLYLVAIVVWAVVGIARLVMRQIRWWWVTEQHQLRSQAAAGGDAREWMKLHKEAKATRQVRGGVLLGELLALVLAVTAVARYAPVWAWLVLAAAAVLLLGRAGRPSGHRIVGTAIVPPDYCPPTHAIISQALGSLNIAQITAALKPDKDGHARGIRFISDVMRDGPGWSTHLDLPHGVSVSTILARREDLASGLRRPLSATWPTAVPEEHPGRMDLWVGFHDISKSRPATWPLLRSRGTDVFAGLPFGTDPRMRPVTVPMFEVNWLIGAAPGQGKTAAVRGLACGVALDVLAEMWIHELAGKGDLEPLAKCCHRYCSGLDDEAIAYTAASLRMLRAELDRRSRAMRAVPKDARPQGKVTREMAGSRSLRLYPLVCFIDEAQNLFMHPVYGGQAAEDAAYVIRLGRAYGITVVLATQRPDKDSLPTAIRGIVTARFCLKVPDQDSNDMILGTGSYKNGYNAAVFRAKTDAGLGWLKADGEPRIVRTYKVDLPEAERAAARARDMRDRAGTLTGYALGEEHQADARDVLADVLAVFEGPGMHWDTLADKLAERWPDRWADVSGDAVSAQLRAKGVPSVMVSVGGSKARGCRRVAVEREAAR